jgi:hypothetical protein
MIKRRGGCSARTKAGWLLVPFLMLAHAAAAQTANTPGFLTAYRFHLNAARVSDEDQRFDWDAAFGGDVDLVDYGAGRINLVADYSAILGSELRRFDPNQSAYQLDGSATWRTRAGELAVIFHHVSRHLSDRPKQVPIDWNTLGIGYGHTMTTRTIRVGMSLAAFRVVKRSHVDYTGEIGGAVRVDRTMTPHVGVYAGTEAKILTVAPSVLGRARQTGGRAEAGLRLLGRAGALELFGAYERRIDADPFDGRARTWALAGFRLVGGR